MTNIATASHPHAPQGQLAGSPGGSAPSRSAVTAATPGRVSATGPPGTSGALGQPYAPNFLQKTQTYREPLRSAQRSPAGRSLQGISHQVTWPDHKGTWPDQKGTWPDHKGTWSIATTATATTASPALVAARQRPAGSLNPRHARPHSSTRTVRRCSPTSPRLPLRMLPSHHGEEEDEVAALHAQLARFSWLQEEESSLRMQLARSREEEAAALCATAEAAATATAEAQELEKLRSQSSELEELATHAEVRATQAEVWAETQSEVAGKLREELKQEAQEASNAVAEARSMAQGIREIPLMLKRLLGEHESEDLCGYDDSKVLETCMEANAAGSGEPHCQDWPQLSEALCAVAASLKEVRVSEREARREASEHVAELKASFATERVMFHSELHSEKEESTDLRRQVVWLRAEAAAASAANPPAAPTMHIPEASEDVEDHEDPGSAVDDNVSNGDCYVTTLRRLSQVEATPFLLSACLAADLDADGLVEWHTGEVRAFVCMAFCHYGLPPPTLTAEVWARLWADFECRGSVRSVADYELARIFLRFVARRLYEMSLLRPGPSSSAAEVAAALSAEPPEQRSAGSVRSDFEDHLKAARRAEQNLEEALCPGCSLNGTDFFVEVNEFGIAKEWWGSSTSMKEVDTQEMQVSSPELMSRTTLPWGGNRVLNWSPAQLPLHQSRAPVHAPAPAASTQAAYFDHDYEDDQELFDDSRSGDADAEIRSTSMPPVSQGAFEMGLRRPLCLRSPRSRRGQEPNEARRGRSPPRHYCAWSGRSPETTPAPEDVEVIAGLKHSLIYKLSRNDYVPQSRLM